MTLLELLVVVALMAVLASFAIVSYEKFVAGSYKAQATAFLFSCMAKLEKGAYAEHGTIYDWLQDAGGSSAVIRVCAKEYYRNDIYEVGYSITSGTLKIYLEAIPKQKAASYNPNIYVLHESRKKQYRLPGTSSFIDGWEDGF